MRIAFRVGLIGTALLLTGGQASNAASTRLEAVQYCEINPLGVGAQTIVDAQTSDSLEGKTVFSRYLFRIDCEMDTRRCKGMRFNIGNIEAGKPVGLVDVVLPTEMRIAAVQGRVATIAWTIGNVSAVTITIDLDRKRFEYRSSGKYAQVLGVGACPPLKLTLPPRETY